MPRRLLKIDRVLLAETFVFAKRLKAQRARNARAYLDLFS